MTIIQSRRLTLALCASVVGALSFAACGDGSARNDAAPPQSSIGPLPAIVAQAPNPDEISARAAAAESDAGSEKAAPGAATDSMMRLAWVHYSVDGTLPDLPAVGSAWRLDSAKPVDEQRMAAIAAAFGVTDPLVQLSEQEGGGWRAGPNDGSAPSVTFTTSPTLDWYYSAAYGVGTVAAADCADGGAASPPDSSASEPASTDDVTVKPAPVEGEGGGDSAVHCADPKPPANVPSNDDALARARQLFTAAGLDPAGYAFDVAGDDWGRYVTASPLLGDLRSPLTTSIGFGGDAAITWAGGSLATPVQVGDYPLISTTEGVERLNQQNQEWGHEAIADAGGAAAASADTGTGASSTAEGGSSAPAAAPADSAQTPASEPVVLPTEPAQPIEVKITGVRPDITQLWDVDGVVWLLPAYTYTNADGVVATVAAVTSQYFSTPTPAG